MVQFSNCAEYNKWSEAQKLAHLRNSLEGDAATILWDYGADTATSWKGLTELLETRFGGKRCRRSIVLNYGINDVGLMRPYQVYMPTSDD